jgi:4a-hydroxytetrahydrobiopterin dehydratase
MSKLDEEEVLKRIRQFNGWGADGGVLSKEFEFKDFTEAIEFMNALAPVAEKLNHHPDWSNSYNKVLIKLTTHSEGGLTDKDFAFAEAADKIFKQFK